ncbi:YxeA family protein [Lactobacillus sp. LL6]|uniref:YxeA family protein n=1 Tax=Lactobacillus sp. LL6 TaxID=2596827 RepID=UPI001184A129|nr:YxeA family protein [Lactobacillus sp. LL6]TSO27027.1 YxeA family protein [Lactobacillus sp. LL6]
MFRKDNIVKIIIGVALLIAAFVIIGSAVFPRNRFEYVSMRDRINPLISQTTSYAKVQKGTQSYDNVQAIDSKTGKNLSYRLDHVGGYDPSREYISINHKGQYVKEITYISKTKYEQAQK